MAGGRVDVEVVVVLVDLLGGGGCGSLLVRVSMGSTVALSRTLRLTGAL